MFTSAAAEGETVLEAFKAAYFVSMGEKVKVRKVGGEWGDWDQTYIVDSYSNWYICSTGNCIRNHILYPQENVVNVSLASTEDDPEVPSGWHDTNTSRGCRALCVFRIDLQSVPHE